MVLSQYKIRKRSPVKKAHLLADLPARKGKLFTGEVWPESMQAVVEGSVYSLRFQQLIIPRSSCQQSTYRTKLSDWI